MLVTPLGTAAGAGCTVLDEVEIPLGSDFGGAMLVFAEAFCPFTATGVSYESMLLFIQEEKEKRSP